MRIDVRMAIRDVTQLWKSRVPHENNDYHCVTPWLAARGHEPLVYDAVRDDLVPMTSPTLNTFYMRAEHRSPLRPAGCGFGDDDSTEQHQL